MTQWILYFLTGGTLTTIIVALEESNYRTLSGLAAIVPIFTLVSYFFIGSTKSGHAVSEHSQFVLWGTVIAWIPYMMTVAILSPKYGTNKAIVSGLAVFFVLALLYLFIVHKFDLFQ